MKAGTPYGNFIRGNNDKLMITYRREPSHDYRMYGACGVLYEGEMHFFGSGFSDFFRQHFVIETQRTDKLVKMVRKQDLDMRFQFPACRSFQITSEYFSWFQTNVVILCFDTYHRKSCYLFDGKLIHIGESNFEHNRAGLAKYKKIF